jgi:hypothetical protein
MPTRRMSAPTTLVVCMVFLIGGAAFAQSALKSGIRGRVIIARELSQATTQPIDPGASAWFQTQANVRRHTGRGIKAVLTEPAPELLIVVEGEKPQTSEVRAIRFKGLRFVPSSLLVPKPARLKIYNDEAFPISVGAADVKDRIEPGGSVFLDLPAGRHDLRVLDQSFARADVNVLEMAIVLPVKADGLIDAVMIEPGDYQLGFYWGATPLQVQSVTIGANAMVAIDASISANRVVTVSVKDGELQVAAPPPPPPPLNPKPAESPPE